MNSEVKLKFTVENVKFESTHDKRFRRALIYAFADGENPHTHPISLETLERGSGTVYDIPILAKYSETFEDFEGHEVDEIPIGFIKESTSTYNNPIRFESVDDGRTFLVIEGTLWTEYSKQYFDVIERDKNKSVSVELTCSGEEIDDKIEVNDYVLQGVTVLGDFVRPAIKGANLQLEFSKYKQEFLSSKDFADVIKINNSKESAVSGQWENPRRKLFTPLVRASNTMPLLKEAYLVGDFSTEQPEITKFKYPHHVVRDGQLVIHIRGLQAAFQRAKQEDIFSGGVRAHIARHYRELGLSTENFTYFDLSENEFETYFAEFCNNEERVGETSMAKETNKEEMARNENFPGTVPAADVNGTAVPAAIVNGDTVPAAKNEVNKFEDGEKPTEDKKMEDGHDGDDDSDDKKMCDDVIVEQSMEEKITEMQSIIEELKDANSKLEISNRAYMEKLESMKDYDDLKRYKKESELRFEKEQQMTKMSEILDGITSRGIEMSDDDKTELISKFDEFSNIDTWANFAKAYLFDRMEKVADDGVIRIGNAYPTQEQNTNNSIWFSFPDGNE